MTLYNFRLNKLYFKSLFAIIQASRAGSCVKLNNFIIFLTEFSNDWKFVLKKSLSEGRISLVEKSMIDF